MVYYLGIDGGGTKTAYLISDEKGNTLSALEARSTDYNQLGIGETVDELTRASLECLAEVGVPPGQVDRVCMGLPCFGENPGADEQILKRLKERYFTQRFTVINDVQVAWAGALAGERGINIVSGTGSIAYGMDEEGRAARSGGWSSVFGDEGSCAWLGRLAMGLFTKQADGRSPRGPLYGLVREQFGLEDDLDFVPLMEGEYCPDRSRAAAFQKVLFEAARLGDRTALELYEEAARELYEMAAAIKDKLRFAHAPVKVSYTGGLFHVGAYILEPLGKLLSRDGMALVPPKLSPVEGAALMAREGKAD